MNLRARLNTVKGVKDSPQKAEQLFLIFEQALAASDRVLAMEARIAESRVRSVCIDDEPAIIAMAWCAAEYNAHKEELRDFFDEIVANAAWIPCTIANKIHIPVEKVFESLESFRHLLQENGVGMRMYYERSIKPYGIIGEIEKAQEAVNKAKQENHDRFCYPKNAFFIQELAVALAAQRYQEVIRIFENIDIDAVSIYSQKTAYAAIAWAYVSEENIPQAQYYMQLSVKKDKEISTEPEVETYAESIMMSVLAQDEAAGLQQWEEIVQYVPITYCQFCILMFFKASRELFTQLSKKTKTISLHMPDSVEWYTDSGVYSTQTLVSFFTQNAKNLAQKIDERNKNTYYTDMLNQYH